MFGPTNTHKNQKLRKKTRPTNQPRNKGIRKTWFQTKTKYEIWNFHSLTTTQFVSQRVKVLELVRIRNKTYK